MRITTASAVTALTLAAVAAATLAYAADGTRPDGHRPGTEVARVQGQPQETATPKPPEAERLPTDFVIGPEDVLTVVFWRDEDLSGDVIVRPDGKISLPLLNDIQAAGFTPEQLRDKLVEAAGRYLEEPNVTVVVKEINSRKVFITGEIERPGPYPLTSSMTVLQLIASAGGLKEFADSKNIVVMRQESGRPASYPFNYRDVIRGRNVSQNIQLKPGDTVIVP